MNFFTSTRPWSFFYECVVRVSHFSFAVLFQCISIHSFLNCSSFISSTPSPPPSTTSKAPPLGTFLCVPNKVAVHFITNCFCSVFTLYSPSRNHEELLSWDCLQGGWPLVDMLVVLSAVVVVVLDGWSLKDLQNTTITPFAIQATKAIRMANSFYSGPLQRYHSLSHFSSVCKVYTINKSQFGVCWV